MSMNEFTPAEMKAQLQPRRPGESLKVAQTVLKRRDRNMKAAGERAAKVAKARNEKKYAKKGGALKVLRAEKLIKRNLVLQKDQKRLMNKNKKPLGKPQKGRVVLVARNNRTGGSKVTKKTLKALHLLKKNTVVFMSNTEETLLQLRTVKPFVYWGVPTFKLLTNLVHKKATFRDPAEKKSKELLSDNTVIEKHLGDLGVLCTEDLAHALHTRSEHFDKVKARLWPVDLGNIKKANGMIHDRTYTYGDLKKDINTKIGKLMAE